MFVITNKGVFKIINLVVHKCDFILVDKFGEGNMVFSKCR